MPQSYNGWKNRATWNVSLWIGNDEPLYRSAVAFMRTYKGRKPYMDFVVDAGLFHEKTPDGFAFHSSNLSYGELNTMMRELA